MFGAFEIRSVGSHSPYCKFKTPDSWKLHSVSHIHLLAHYKGEDLKKQVIEVKVDGNPLVNESSIASGPSDKNPQHHVFVVQWTDYLPDENPWETYDNLA